MKITYDPSDDVGGGIYGMGKYVGKISASEYKREVHPQDNPKSNLNNHSTRAKLTHRIKKKFKEKLSELLAQTEILEE